MKNDSIITIGTFDGLHKGHQHLLSNLIELSRKLGLQPMVLTFPMPAKFYLDRENFSGCLTTTLEKINLMKKWVSNVKIMDFEEIKNLEPDVFIDKYLWKRYSMKAVVVGYDFKFGKNRSGNFDFFVNHSNGRYKVFRSEEYRLEGRKISSSEIRKLLKKSRIKEANFLLGRMYFVNGVVVSGMKLARKIGFPTANIKFDPYKVVPGEGVYKVKTIVDGMDYDSIGYISTRIENGTEYKNLEVHIFNFDKDIYSKPIRVVFEDFVRKPMKFGNLEEAKKQIEKDIKETLKNCK